MNRFASGPRVRGARTASAAGLVLSVALLAGCATRADLERVRQDQREVRALLADQQVAVEGLRRRVEILRGDLSESGRRAGGAASGEVAQRLKDLDARMAALEQARPVTAVPGVPPSGGAPTDGAPPERPIEAARPPDIAPTPAPPKNPQEAALAKEEAALQGARVDGDYREALQLVRQGQCTQAVPKLRDFIRKNAKSDYADNAQYWIGACYYGQRDYSRAIVELNDLILKYQKGDKVPAALLLMADAFADSGDKIDARLVLQKLLSQHSGTEEATRGREKLQALGD